MHQPAASIPHRPMRFIIRADASNLMGAGHVMRCIAIAEELAEKGHEVILVGQTKNLPWVEAKVNSSGFSRIYSNPANLRPDPDADVLILDSYEIDPIDPFLDSRKWRKVVALVDDTTPKFHADLYIHPGSGTTWLPPEKERKAPFVSGIEYIAIRKSIQNLKRNARPKVPDCLRILVTGGGSDPYDFCGEIVKMLQKLSVNFSAKVFSQSKEIQTHDARFVFVEIGSKLEEFLPDTDLIFTTAGTSSWEFLSCGFPIGLACAVDNQVANFKCQTQNGLAMGIGERNNHQSWELDEVNIEKLVSNPQIRNELSVQARGQVDGKGSARIVEVILGILQ